MISEAKKILLKYWGYSDFRPMQEEIIGSILQDTDTMALMPTGGGKSICFQVPAMIKEGVCLVITPLIALMKDQVDNLRKLSIPAAAIYTGLHYNQMESIYSGCINGQTKILYISPERLENEAFQHVLSKIKVSLITVDEAHCISQWGYDFRPPYLRIAAIRPILPGVPVLALTATATPTVVEDILHRLGMKNRKVYRASFFRRNLSYQIRQEADKTGALLNLLNQERGSAIVYVRNRKKTRELSDILTTNKILSTFYHAGLADKLRDERQKQWSQGKVRVIVATNAFGMGIDKADVRQVIHYDLPDCIESYFQEAGRAGRDQKPATCTLLYSKNDISQSKERLKQSYPAIDKIRRIYNALGNYFQIPEGSGKDLAQDFDISDFSKQYSFNIIEVYNSIKFLEREGYLFYKESAGQFSKLFIPLDREQLYRFMVENKSSDRFLKEILRSYGGVLTDYVNINESQLGKRTEMKTEEVKIKLQYLDKIKIVNYIPVNTKPQVILASQRINARQVIFSEENYKLLKDAAEQRYQDLIHFLTNNLNCRSQQLLAYFGEKNAQRCGICDVCLSKNTTQLNAVEFESIREKIAEVLSREPAHLYYLISRLSAFQEEKVVSVVRWLLDKKIIIRQADEKLRWQEQLDLDF